MCFVEERKEGRKRERRQGGGRIITIVRWIVGRQPSKRDLGASPLNTLLNLIMVGRLNTRNHIVAQLK
jgi:hypothetical protein